MVSLNPVMLLCRVRFFLALGLLMVGPMFVPAGVVHVSVDGDDRATGEHRSGRDGKGPVRTAEVAVARARALIASGGGGEVEFEAGRYPLASPLRFSPEDSGMALRARPGAKVEIAGGMRLLGWRRSPGNESLWEAPYARAALSQLFVNGRRAPVVRRPRSGWFRATGPLGSLRPMQLPVRMEDVRPEWVGKPGVTLVMLMKWTDLHTPVLSVDRERSIIALPGGPRAAWMDEPDARYWVENPPEPLVEPGSWGFDASKGLVRYLSQGGLSPDTLVITTPVLERLVEIDGDAAGRPVTGLRFERLRFVETGFAMPADGIASPQAAVDLHGAVTVRHSTRCEWLDCEFANLGGYGLELGRGCQQARVEGCRFADLGAGGIRVGEPGDRSPGGYDANFGHEVADNEFEHLGRIFAPAVGVIIFQSHNNRVAHNHIHDLFYTGISVGWTWGYEASPCHDNRIEFNLIEDVGQGRLSDLGGIYTLGPQPGTVLRGNVIRRVDSYGYGGWGLYTDEGSTGILIENNLCEDCKSAGFHQHYGRDNVLRYNVFLGNREHSLMRTRSEPHRSFVFTNNVVVFQEGSLLGSDWSGTPENFVMDGNLYWNPKSGPKTETYAMAGQAWGAWRERGFDTHSVTSDPRWVDPARPELGFRRDSPVWKLGLHWLDLTQAGVRPPGHRRD